MDGQFSAFVTPSGGGLFAYNAPESQFPKVPGAAGATSGTQSGSTSPQNSQRSPVNAPKQATSPTPQQSSSSPTPQQQPQPQQAAPAPAPEAVVPVPQVPAQPSPPPQVAAPQQTQQPAPQPAPAQAMPQQPKAPTPVHMQPSSNSLFETLLNDSYNGGQSASSSLDAAINSLGNNLSEMRLGDGVGPSAQAFLASQGMQQPQQQLHQPNAIPNFLQFQQQAANPTPQQYMQQASAAHFLQQNAALLAQQPLLAQQAPLLAQHALVQNVYNKYGLGGPGYPTPIKTPGAPIKTTDSDKGPEGCNLFVFHIPNDMTNLDLYQMFSTFGQVISARIMVDKVTGRSRGFGFVSYNNPDSAEQAIKSMNGFVVGHKRLKVEQKKDKNSVMPPSAAHPGAAYYATLQRYVNSRWQMHLHNQAHAHLQAQAHAQVPPAAASAHYLAPPTGLYPSS